MAGKGLREPSGKVMPSLRIEAPKPLSRKTRGFSMIISAG